MRRTKSSRIAYRYEARFRAFTATGSLIGAQFPAVSDRQARRFLREQLSACTIEQLERGEVVPWSHVARKYRAPDRLTFGTPYTALWYEQLYRLARVQVVARLMLLRTFDTPEARADYEYAQRVCRYIEARERAAMSRLFGIRAERLERRKQPSETIE